MRLSYLHEIGQERYRHEELPRKLPLRRCVLRSGHQFILGLAAAPVTFIDGKNDNWSTPPAETGHL